MSQNVMVFKLTTGEEVIGVLDTELSNSGVFIVKLPLAIGLDHNNSRLVFVPFMPYTTASKEAVFFTHALVMDPVVPVESLVNDYLEATGQKPKILMPNQTIALAR